VAIPAFLNYITRAKTAEAPSILKTITESQVAFFQKPRSDASGNEATACAVMQAIVPDNDPDAAKQSWLSGTAPDGFNFVGASVASQVYFSYATYDADAIVADSAGAMTVAAGAHACSASGSTLTQATASTDNNFQVAAYGDLDGDDIESTFARQLTVASDVMNAGGISIALELE